MICCWKIFNDKSCIAPDSLFSPAPVGNTRGHPYKVGHVRAQTDVRRRSFSIRCVDQWNRLPANVVLEQNYKSFKQKLAMALGNELYWYPWNPNVSKMLEAIDCQHLPLRSTTCQCYMQTQYPLHWAHNMSLERGVSFVMWVPDMCHGEKSRFKILKVPRQVYNSGSWVPKVPRQVYISGSWVPKVPCQVYISESWVSRVPRPVYPSGSKVPKVPRQVYIPGSWVPKVPWQV